MAKLKIALTPDEVYLVRSALESAEYWEHRDQLDHDSGYITDPTKNDAGEWVDVNDEPLDEEAKEAWASVLKMRALDAKFALVS